MVLKSGLDLTAADVEEAANTFFKSVALEILIAGNSSTEDATNMAKLVSGVVSENALA